MIFRKKNSTKEEEEEEHSQEIIFLIPEFTVQVVFRQPRRVIANGALHLPLMSDFNECTRVPGRQGVAIIAFKQPRAAPVCSGPAEMEGLVDSTQTKDTIQLVFVAHVFPCPLWQY